MEYIWLILNACFLIENTDIAGDGMKQRVLMEGVSCKKPTIIKHTVILGRNTRPNK